MPEPKGDQELVLKGVQLLLPPQNAGTLVEIASTKIGSKSVFFIKVYDNINNNDIIISPYN